MRSVSFLIVLLCVVGVAFVSAQDSVSHEVVKNQDGSVTVTATATSSVNVPVKAAEAEVVAAPLVGASIGGRCSSGSRTGTCQVSTSRCSGTYVSNLCPGTPNNVRCCLGGSTSSTTPAPAAPAASTAGAGPFAARALAIGITQIGVREQGGDNRGRQVEIYQSTNGGQRGESWCGHFVAWCYRQAGSQAPQRQRWAVVYSILGKPGISRTTNPLPGDLVVFNTFSHVGLLERIISSSQISTIEGNTSGQGERSNTAGGGDGVHRRTRARSLVRYYLRVAN